MGYLAGLVSKDRDDVSTFVQCMLDRSSMLRGDSYGFSSPRNVEIFQSKPDFPSIVSDIILGYKQIIGSPNNPPQPIFQKTGSIVMDGHLWDKKEPEILDVANLLRWNPENGIKYLITERDGSYVLAVACDDGILCARDHVGTVPLYYGESKSLVGIASNKKMLWVAGLEPKPLHPGNLLKININGAVVNQIKFLEKPSKIEVSMENAVDLLDDLIYKAVEVRALGVKHASLGFSGGLDSSLLAYYLDRCGVEVELICVGLEGSNELVIAEKNAEEMGLSYQIKPYPPEHVDETLDQVLLSVEDANPMKIGVALPQYWTALEAKKKDPGVIYSGNGSDELFGGYMKFVQQHLSGERDARESIYQSVVNSHDVNYERDTKLYADNGLELRLPFSDANLIRFGLSLPLKLKLPSTLRGLRKRVLRHLAKRLDLPEDVVNRPKKAIQYSTGVNKVLVKLAKDEGKDLYIYLVGRLNRVKKSIEPCK